MECSGSDAAICFACSRTWSADSLNCMAKIDATDAATIPRGAINDIRVRSWRVVSVPTNPNSTEAGRMMSTSSATKIRPVDRMSRI